jgi:DNA invertase Pin-like site-specific DNA recombinase
MNDASFLPSTCGVTVDKIQRWHRERAAMVYIRQSTVQQIERNQESTRLQYALVDGAFQFGWARESIVVIDDDLGRSGATIEGRLGFQRLVAEVGLGHVGLVLGVEMSRLARSCRDWHQLLEICALFDTLIADADGVYDPSSYNDRLLLGLKGTMSETELHILKARTLEGRRAKARRGELGKPVPMGYIRRPSGEIAFDPDEQAQATIRLTFDLFERFRTAGKVMRYLVNNDIRMPVRVRGGPRKGELEMAPCQPGVVAQSAYQSDLRRSLCVWRTIDRPPTAEAGPTRNGSPSIPHRERRRFPSRPAARLHQLGAISAQSIAAAVKQGGPHRGGACRAGAAVRDDDLRSLWPADGGAIQQQWSACPLRLHPHGL